MVKAAFPRGDHPRGGCRKKEKKFSEKVLTNQTLCYIIHKLSDSETKYAAIAQQVERILGKDEVASSNLASSSKKEEHLPVFLFFHCVRSKEEVLGEMEDHYEAYF